MKKLIKAHLLSAMLLLCIVQPSWALPTGGSISGSVAEYNAAQVRGNNGLITVPSGMVTYTANTAIPVGTVIDVALSGGLEFTTPTLPSLSSSDETFSLVSTSGGSASFQVLTSDGAPTSKIILGSYTLKGATALEKVIPVVGALPLSMQAIGIDPAPLAFPEFASDTGIQAVFVGAVQFIDLSPPSNGSEFGYSGSDSPIAVISAIAITPETVDYANQSTPLLSPDGEANTLASDDTVTVEFPGALWGNISAFTDNSSNCVSPVTVGTVTSNALIFPDVPLNQEIFFCVKANGRKIVQMLGFPGSDFFGTGPAFTTVILHSSHLNDDYLTSANVNIEFPGLLCYSYHVGLGANCIDEYFNFLASRD